MGSALRTVEAHGRNVCSSHWLVRNGENEDDGVGDGKGDDMMTNKMNPNNEILYVPLRCHHAHPSANTATKHIHT